jgi:hypothetical protein
LKWLVACALALSAPVHAGPWCGGGRGWSPIGKHLPRHPHLVYWREATYYGGKAQRTARLPIQATIDGKAVNVVVSDVTVGAVLLRFVEIASDRSGALQLSWKEMARDDPDPYTTTVDYTIDESWTAGETAAPTVTRYHKTHVAERASDSKTYEGAAITTDTPAIAFTARWRRDAKDSWRTLRLPAVDEDGHATAFVGQTMCSPDTIPLELLERGIELELKATLPDGKERALALPAPFKLGR